MPTAHFHGGPLDGQSEEVDELYPTLRTVVQRDEPAYASRPYPGIAPPKENAYIEHVYHLDRREGDDTGHYGHIEPRRPHVEGTL